MRKSGAGKNGGGSSASSSLAAGSGGGGPPLRRERHSQPGEGLEDFLARSGGRLPSSGACVGVVVAAAICTVIWETASEIDGGDGNADGSDGRGSRKQIFALEIPRVSMEELKNNSTLRTGNHAFILTNSSGPKWKAMNWTLKKLRKKIPDEWVDYYIESLASLASKPYLFHFDQAVPLFKDKSPRARYMQIRLSLKGYRRLQKDFGRNPLSEVFYSDDTWMKECMRTEGGRIDEKAMDNFFKTSQWKCLLIGENGTSMFFHKDKLAASAWQTQIRGRKQWTLCPPHTDANLLSTDIDTFDPDYKRFPGFARAYCGQTFVHPGEVLYYPAYFWHHARQLDTPTIAYTGLLIGNERDREDISFVDSSGVLRPAVHQQTYADLQTECRKCWTPKKSKRHCDDLSIQWPGAAPPPMRKVCDDYLFKCLRLWDEHANQSTIYQPG